MSGRGSGRYSGGHPNEIVMPSEAPADFVRHWTVPNVAQNHIVVAELLDLS
jgi:hypothetical protein